MFYNNIVCLTISSKENRLDPLTKYIYSSVTSLFADDISDNFIILTTNADQHKLKKPKVFWVMMMQNFFKLKKKIKIKVKKDGGIHLIV